MVARLAELQPGELPRIHLCKSQCCAGIHSSELGRHGAYTATASFAVAGPSLFLGRATPTARISRSDQLGGSSVVGNGRGAREHTKWLRPGQAAKSEMSANVMHVQHIKVMRSVCGEVIYHLSHISGYGVALKYVGIVRPAPPLRLPGQRGSSPAPVEMNPLYWKTHPGDESPPWATIV